MPENEPQDFYDHWHDLTQLSDRINQRGFDEGQTLLTARHEIRSLAHHPLDDSRYRYLVLAGDKLGAWYAAKLDIEHPAGPRACRLPQFRSTDGHDRVVDDLLVVPSGKGHSVVAATRGNGAWIARLEQVIAHLDSSPDSRSAIDLERLPESTGRAVSQLTWDQASGTLLAVAQHDFRSELFVWSIGADGPSLMRREQLPYRLTALTIDRADEALGDPGDAADQLYVATGRFELYSFERGQRGPPVELTAAARDEQRRNGCQVWSGRLSPILDMRPLSDVSYRDPASGRRRRSYPHRGVLATTLRHLLVIYDTPDQPGDARCHARLVVGKTKNLALSVFNLAETDEDRCPQSGWHGVAVSTLEGAVRIFRPSGVRRPEAGGFDPFPRDVPEMKWPTVLISGYKDLSPELVPDRVYAMQSLATIHDHGAEVPVLFGLGNNQVRWHLFRLRWRLREEARAAAQDLLASEPSLPKLLDRLQRVALFAVHWQDGGSDTPDFETDPRRAKHALLELIPRLGRQCRSDSEWRELFLLAWDVLARRTPRNVAVGMIQALRRVQLKLLDRGRDPHPLSEEGIMRRQDEVEKHITRMRKFVLDPGTFSKGKSTGFLELASSTDPALEDERVVYRSILIARRHDPVFVTEFESATTGLIGEIMTFTTMPTSTDVIVPFWATTPERMRFLVSNYQGEIWLLDGAGEGYCLIAERAGDSAGDIRAGAIRAAHVFDGDLMLSFSDGRVRRLDLLDVPPTIAEAEPNEPEYRPVPGLPDGRLDATAFATACFGAREDLLWGDAVGRIYRLGDPEPLVDLSTSLKETTLVSPAVLGLAAFQAQWPEGERSFVVAALSSGHLCLLGWQNDTSSLRVIEPRLVCSLPIAALLVTGPGCRHLAVASHGIAIGLQILGSPEEPRLGLVWAFKTQDTVRSIQAVVPSEAGDRERNDSYRVLVGSHDAHIYALDLEGRHLETYSFRQDMLRQNQGLDGGFKIGLFVTAPPRECEDDDSVLIRIYACAFENRFCGLRLIDRPKMLDRFAEEMEHLDDAKREDLLTRWRAYHVDEGHLRHRFIRQSGRYPGDRPKEVLRAIEWLVEAGDSSHEPTGEMTALLRRLFKSRHRPSGAAAGQRSDGGLRRILEDEELYLATVRLLMEFSKRWDTPASLANRRVRLFWIRSFLREIADREMFGAWLAVGERAAQQEPLARAENLLRHFLEHSPRLIQYKTLQYLERLLFGWPWVKGRNRLFEPGDATDEELGWLIRCLVSRLRVRPELVQEVDPSPVVLQVGRLLCLLLRDLHLDPLYLTYLLQRYRVPHDMYWILAGQWEALVGDERMEENRSRLSPGEVIRLAGHLDHGLAKAKPLSDLVPILRRLMVRSWPASRGPDKEYLEQAPRYFQSLIPLLEVENLLGMKQLANADVWLPPSQGTEFKYCPTYVELAKLQPLLEAVKNYYEQKFNDQYADPVMTHLQYEDFDRVRREWESWRSGVEDLLAERPPDLADREARLMKRLVEAWAVVLEEENTALLKDFQRAVDHTFFGEMRPSRFSAEALQELRNEKQLAVTAFTNLFIRLVLFAEPVEAAFLSRDAHDREVLGFWFRAGLGGAAELSEISAEGELPDWISADWLELDAFRMLGVSDIEERVKAVHAEREWRVKPIIDSPGENRYLGFYVFSWDDEQAAGYQRYESQRLAWAMPLQALVYRRAAVEQEELKGRLFSIVAHNLGSPLYQMRSGLRVLVDGFLEKFEERRYDKYRQLLRQARHMDAIVDSILSLSDREIEVDLSEVAVSRLAYEVVRTVRPEAKVKNVRIEYPEPSPGKNDSTTILTDETKVYDILLNLLVNAVKYSERGQRVEVSVEPSPKGVEVRVEDRGLGVPANERGRIFEPFFRGARAQQVAGLGLGLYSAKLYADLLQGHIQAYDAREGGSMFTLFLPYLEEDAV
ncbi:MAG: HAMP domain-containing sensor histidine kinase [Acidobacteriota bacterium]